MESILMLTQIQKMPPSEYLNECFYLNEKTGSLFWKERPLHHFNYNEKIYKGFLKRKSGKIAGCIIEKNKKYRRLRLDQVLYKEHRIIFKMFYGYDPEYVDHINGIHDDNRPLNLRSVTIAENNKNKPLQKNNKSGLIGVDKCGNKWRSNSKKQGRKYFDTFEEAVSWKKEMNKKYGYHANHGRINNENQTQ
jgi:hypothetical protein